MAAGIWNPTIQQGETWTRTVSFNDPHGIPIDLTGYVAVMPIRQADGTLIVQLETLTSLGADETGITVGDSALTLRISSIDSASFPAGYGYPWMLYMTDPNGAEDIWLKGVFRATEQVAIA